MHKIDGDAHVNGTFSAGNVSNGTPATMITAEWLNAVQEEIINVVLDAGFPLDKGDNAQLLAALKSATLGWVKKTGDTLTGQLNLPGGGVGNQAITKAEADALVPTGTVIAWPQLSCPAGWLVCNGAGLYKVSYAELFAVIGYTYGQNGDWFHLPDFRSMFLRGLDEGRGMTGNSLGFQDQSLKAHTHTTAGHIGSHFYYSAGGGNSAVGTPYQEGGDTGSTGSEETRPINYGVRWLIKY